MRSPQPDRPSPSSLPFSALAEPESLDQLIGDCRQMAEHWKAPATKARSAAAPVGLHGIVVPPESAHVVDEMAEFGD